MDKDEARLYLTDMLHGCESIRSQSDDEEGEMYDRCVLMRGVWSKMDRKV